MLKISTLKIIGLYGCFNKIIDFNEDITILVGINGSGKTSILNIINWLLRPSLPHLCTTQFKLLQLSFTLKDEEHILQCKQGKRSLKIFVSNKTKNKDYNQLRITLRMPTSEITNNEELRQRLFAQYQSLGPDSKEAETWDFLANALPKPVVIGIDRNLYAEEARDLFLAPPDLIKRNMDKNYVGKKTPLDRVKEFANKEYSRYRSRLIELNDKLKEKIMLSAFDITTEQNLTALIKNRSIITLEQVKTLENKVKTYLSQNISQSNLKSPVGTEKISDNKVELYFDSLKKMIANMKADEPSDRWKALYIINTSQFSKIKELIREFEDYEKKSSAVFADLKEYLETINGFFKDSSKRLTFNEQTGELLFDLLNKEDKVISRSENISNLSSGERQILILFTYLKFSQGSKLIIIDEPELSLHPKWQEDFLTSVRKLMPITTQLILATHSPEIVGKEQKVCCRVLLPYNT